MNTKYLSALKTNFINENELDSLLSEIQDLPGHPQSLTTLQDCGYKMGVIHEDYFNVMSSFTFQQFEKSKRSILYVYDKELVYKHIQAIQKAKYVLPLILKEYENTERKLKELIEGCIAEKQKYQRNFELRQRLREVLQKKLSELTSDNEDEYKKLSKLNDLNSLQIVNSDLSLKSFDMAINLAKDKLGNFDIAKTHGDMWNTNYSIKALQSDNKALIEISKDPEKYDKFNIRDLSLVNYVCVIIFVLVLLVAGLLTLGDNKSEIKEPVHFAALDVYNMVNGSNPSSTIGKHNKEFFLKNYESTVQIYNKSQDVLVEYLNGSRTLTPQNREAIQKGYTILLQLADLKKDDITFSINPDIKYSYEYALGITKKNDNFSGFWNFYYKAVVYWFLFILIPFGIL
ncbi:TPA: hypothetical protein ACJETN_002990, partial [Acinetobacter baumannii]